jgi:hypothetical protein
MRVHELIALLKTVDPESEVFVWVDGERHPVTEIDPIDWYVDINADTKERMKDEQVHCLKCDHVWNEQASPDACPHCGNTDKEQTAYLTTP